MVIACNVLQGNKIAFEQQNYIFLNVLTLATHPFAASKKARIHKVTLSTHHPILCKKPITKTTSNQSFITQPLNVVKANNKNMLFILYTISTKPQTPPKQNYKITTQTYNFRNLLCNSA
jgi:hypothetical protein